MNKEFYSADAEMTNVESKDLLATKLKAKNLLTSILTANNKTNTLTINSFLKIKGEIKYESGNASAEKTSFIQLSHESLFLNNVKQWKLLGEFELKDLNAKLNAFIASSFVHNQWQSEEKNQKNSLEVRKNIPLNSKSLNSAQHLFIEANFKFANHLWNNNTAYMKVGDDLFWMDHHIWEENSSVNSGNFDCDLEKWNTPIRIILSLENNRKILTNNNNFVTITFGVKLSNKHSLDIGKCPDAIKVLNNNAGVEFDNLHISIK